MSVLPIVLWPDPSLKKTCEPVPVDLDIEDLVTNMFQTMYAVNGRVIAGPQVGVHLKLFVCDLHWREGDLSPMICVNPEIVDYSDEEIMSTERCLSTLDLEVTIPRKKSVRIKFRDIAGNAIVRDFNGLEAALMQHEIDNINGTLPWDHLPVFEKREKIAEFQKMERL